MSQAKENLLNVQIIESLDSLGGTLGDSQLLLNLSGFRSQSWHRGPEIQSCLIYILINKFAYQRRSGLKY